MNVTQEPNASALQRLGADDKLAVDLWRRMAASYWSAEPAEQFSSLMLSMLWPAVGRALRKKADSQRFTLEEATISVAEARSCLKDLAPQLLINMLMDLRAALVNRPLRREIEKQRACSSKRPIVYAPFHGDRLATTLELLVRRGQCTVWIGSGNGRQSDSPASRIVPHGCVDRDLVRRIQQLIEFWMKESGLELLEKDRRNLHAQIGILLWNHARVHVQLKAVRPDLLLVHADNHPPHQLYVFAARQLGIRTLVVQHGLDCEIAALDEAYADVIAVWGLHRKERYEALSQHRARYVVTGNPEFDRRHRASRLARGGAYWLWVTRPHGSDKCYLPSRWPDEGCLILKALLAALAESPVKKLLIKPHPYDTINLYREMLDAPEHKKVVKRVSIVGGDIWKFLPEAETVISEDSTAGLEAMLAGKPVVHVHFADSPPAMPFAEWGGAYPAVDASSLGVALRKIESMNESELAAMEAGQRRTLEALAGPDDGSAAQRVASLVDELAAGAWK